ncbi:MAG: hypothetical protein ACREGI_04130, partial [Candidatus Levyibacteriota bacterium]
GMTRQQLTDQVRIQKLLEKMFANDIKVSDKEVDDYIAKNKDTLPQNQSDAQTRSQVTTQLQQQKLSDKAQALFQTLQTKAKITYFINL